MRALFQSESCDVTLLVRTRVRTRVRTYYVCTYTRVRTRTMLWYVRTTCVPVVPLASWYHGYHWRTMVLSTMAQRA
jgi:hypothetical protein